MAGGFKLREVREEMNRFFVSTLDFASVVFCSVRTVFGDVMLESFLPLRCLLQKCGQWKRLTN